MILDKKQNFSLKPLSVACLLAMSISGCSSGSGSQPSTVQVTDVLGAENVSQEDQPTTSEGIGSGVEQPVAPSAPITDQPPVNLELDQDDSSSNDGGLSSGIADHGNTSPTEDSLLDSNDATVLENNDVNQPDTIPTVESPPSEAEQPVDVVAPPAVEPVLTDTVLVDSAIQDIEVPQDTSEVEMGSTIQEPEPSQDTLEVETGSAFLETPATNDEAADIQMDAAIIDAVEAEEHYFDPAALLQQPSYVAPVSTAQLSKPQYVRAVQAELQNAQPQASAGTLAGYAVMDSSNNSNLTEAMYGLSEADYAAELGALKTKIDTRNMHVGVIDTGIDPNNPDLNNVNLHDSQVVCTQNPLCYYSEQGLENLSYTDHQASHDHGSQMAAIIAGNNGLSNARIYGSDSIGSGSNGGNQFLIISKINRDSQGEVKIFNNSWGGDNSGLWTQLTRNERYDAATGVGNGDLATVHDLILNRDVLLLKATGNEGLDNSSDENLLPDFNPRFKEGFIAVSAPREDFSGANLCGDAAEWCLAAPSSTQNYSNSGQLQNYKGTSPATARVTGTAVLVKAAYPWMKNHNLVQTILGTAKDFDDIRSESTTYRGIVQVDEVPEHVWSYWRDGQGNFYIEGEAAWENRNRNSRDHHGKTITYESGWGLLDTVAATQGYGGFYWDDVQLDTAGTPVSVFSNDLKGNKGFTKSGEGKLVFTGNNQYLGDSIIRGGVLEINGNNGPSKFQLHAGELTGYGSISDVQQTGGWLNNEGNLTITGNYSMQIAADQQQHAGFKARFGNLLTITGTANLAGTLNLFDEVPLDQPLITAQGSQTTVLRAQQGVQREFDAYRSSNPLFELTQVSYRPELNATGEPVRAADTINTDVVITAKRKSTETVAALATELEGRTQVARNLDVVLASLDQKQQLETLEDAEKVFANRLFNNFAQTIRYSNAAESTVSTQALNQLFHQLDPSFYANTVLNVAEESSKQERQFAQRLATAQPKQLWFSGDYQSYDMDYVGLNSERRSHHQGVGVATKLAGMTLAAQADFSQLDLDDTVQTGSKNSSQSKAYALTLGTAQQLNRDLSVAAWLKGMQVDVDAQRGHAQAQKIQFDGQMYAAGLRLDYSYPLSQKMQIQPYLDASFQHYVHAEQTQQDAVNSLDDLVMQRWNLGAGLQANYQLNPAWQLQGSLYYSQPIQEKAYLDTHYVGTMEQLTFDAWHADQGQYHAALGSQLHFGQHSFINLNYEYSGRSHSDSYRVQLAVTTRF